MSQWVEKQLGRFAKDSDQTQIPDKPHIVFTHDGTLYLPYTVNQAIEKFADDEVGEPYAETLDFYLNHSEFFQTRGRDSAGSRTEYGNVPCLNTFLGKPGVYAVLPDNPSQYFCAGSRDKVLNTNLKPLLLLGWLFFF